MGEGENAETTAPTQYRRQQQRRLTATLSRCHAPGSNDAPVAVADTLAATEDTAVTYAAAELLGNDTDVDSDR